MIKRTLATVLALLILAATFSVPISVSASNVVKCDKCGGDGLLNCSLCSGGGWHYHFNPITKQMENQRCPRCYGSGRQQCDKCNGLGYWTYDDNTSNGTNNNSHTSNKKIYPRSVSLNKHKLTIIKGDTATLTARISPSSCNQKTLKWKSSNKKVASVNKSGTITAKKEAKLLSL